MLILRDIMVHVSEHFQISIPNLKFGRSGITTIVGPSGSGKTTILKIIAGLRAIDRGKITLYDIEIDKMKPGEREIGFVFQDLALFPHMSVEENIRFGLLSKRISNEQIKDRVNKLISLLGLSQFKKRLPSTLSGGEQQRVAIARALAPFPKLLLLDEPFSAIDQPLRVQIRGEIQQLAQEIGIPIILVTHDQEEAVALSQHLVYFDDGELVEEGSPEDLYSRPKKIRTAKFFTDNVLISTESGEIYCFKPWELEIEDAKTGRGKWEVVGSLFNRGKYLLSVNSKEDDLALQLESTTRLSNGTLINVKIPLEAGWRIPLS